MVTRKQRDFQLTRTLVTDALEAAASSFAATAEVGKTGEPLYSLRNTTRHELIRQLPISCQNLVLRGTANIPLVIVAAGTTVIDGEEIGTGLASGTTGTEIEIGETTTGGIDGTMNASGRGDIANVRTVETETGTGRGTGRGGTIEIIGEETTVEETDMEDEVETDTTIVDEAGRLRVA